jgi:hypothetical protein
MPYFLFEKRNARSAHKIRKPLLSNKSGFYSGGTNMNPMKRKLQRDFPSKRKKMPEATNLSPFQTVQRNMRNKSDTMRRGFSHIPKCMHLPMSGESQKEPKPVLYGSHDRLTGGPESNLHACPFNAWSLHWTRAQVH